MLTYSNKFVDKSEAHEGVPITFLDYRLDHIFLDLHIVITHLVVMLKLLLEIALGSECLESVISVNDFCHLTKNALEVKIYLISWSISFL
jgi:hypothetical protein